MINRTELPRLLAIGGSDSSGGAGIQADIKSGAAFGVDVSTAITAITAQNSLGIQALGPVPLKILRAQLASVCSDVPPHAAKLGMLYDAARLEVVAEAISAYQLRNVVCDPVLVSTSGTALLDWAGRKVLMSMLPLFTLFTPNAVEAAELTGIAVLNFSDLIAAGNFLIESGANAVLVKGGHLCGSESTDVLIQKNSLEPVFFSAPRIETRNDHGTGCVLASAIASGLAKGVELSLAVSSACEYVGTALRRSVHLSNGMGRGSMNLILR